MSLQLKTTTNEAGSYTKTYNNVSIDLDPNGATDLSMSYLDCEVGFTVGNAAVPSGPVNLGNINTGTVYSTSCFIKNARIESDVKGLVEEQRYINRLTQTQRTLMTSRAERQASQIEGNEVCIVSPDTQTARIHIPFSEMLGVGSQMWNNQEMGYSHLKLQLEDQVPISYVSTAPYLNAALRGAWTSANKPGPAAATSYTQLPVTQLITLAAAQAIFATPQIGAGQWQIAATGLANPLLITITSVEATGANQVAINFTPALNQPNGTAFTNITITLQQPATPVGKGLSCNDIAAANTTQLVIPADYTQNYLVVGETISIAYRDTAATRYQVFNTTVVAPAPVVGINAQVTLAAAVPTAAATNVCIISNSFQTDYTIKRIDLVSYKPIQPPKLPKTLAFQTYALEMVNREQTTDYRRQFELEPNCDLVYLISPSSLDLVSTRDNLGSYRLTLQGIDTTNRDIIFDTNNNSLYYDRLIMNINNIKSLELKSGLVDVFLITETISAPQPGMPNFLDVRETASGTTQLSQKILYLFKRITKEV